MAWVGAERSTLEISYGLKENTAGALKKQQAHQWDSDSDGSGSSASSSSLPALDPNLNLSMAQLAVQ